MNEESTPPLRHKGIYLLPNLFTVSAMFAGFYAIVAATKGLFEVASIAILVAILLDGIDGRVARLTHSQSDFGAQLDSLSDMVCFGLAPALVLYSWSLSILGKPGWLIAFVYAVCTALRLARFNIESESIGKRYFRGLATPMAAGLIASMIWVSHKYGIDGQSYVVALSVAVIALALAALKVSTVLYRSFKDLDLRNNVPFIAVLVVVIVIVLVAFDPQDVLLGIFAAYVLFGPIETLLRIKKKNHRSVKKNNE